MSPFPAARDLPAEVENGNCTLKWTAAQSAVLPDVYLGTGFESGYECG